MYRSRIHTVDGQRVVTFEQDVSTGEAYDLTQTDDTIKDGDVLIVGSEGVVGVMVGAWPTAATKAHGQFHGLADGFTLDSIDGGKYAAAAKVADKMAKQEIDWSRNAENTLDDWARIIARSRAGS
jgi:hypothetical protein